MDDSTTHLPSDHLLRTLAAVPVSSEILDLGCGDGRRMEALLRLGFPVHACDPRPDAVEAARELARELLEQGEVETVVQEASLDALDYPDTTFDWVVVEEAETYVSDADDLQTVFEEGRRLLKPGGWLYITLPAETEGIDGDGPAQFSTDVIEARRKAADLAEASAPTRGENELNARIHAIYRRVEPHTPA